MGSGRCRDVSEFPIGIKMKNDQRATEEAAKAECIRQGGHDVKITEEDREKQPVEFQSCTCNNGKWQNPIDAMSWAG